jgi:general secretion pathway protein J
MTNQNPSAWPRIASGCSHTSAGFSLVEMLVALALLSMLTVILTTAIGSARLGFIDLEKQAELQRTRAVQSHMRQLFAGMYPARLPRSEPDAPIIATSPGEIHFVTGFAPGGQFGGLYRTTLFLKSRPESGRFDLYEERSIYRASGVGAEAQEVVGTVSLLLANITSLSFQYFQSEGAQPAAGWSEQWRDPVRLPELLEIDVRFPRGDRRTWTPMVVVVPIGQRR